MPIPRLPRWAGLCSLALLCALPRPVGAAPRDGDALIEVAQKGLPTDGFLLEPAGRFAAVLPAGPGARCDLWGLEAGAYLGQVAAERCQGFKPASFLHLPAAFEEEKHPRPKPTTVLSPDGQVRAVAGGGRITLRRVADNQVVRTLALRSGDQVVPGALAYGEGGLLVVAR